MPYALQGAAAHAGVLYAFGGLGTYAFAGFNYYFAGGGVYNIVCAYLSGYAGGKAQLFIELIAAVGSASA